MNVIFPYIGNVIIPLDVHIFQRGGAGFNAQKMKTKRRGFMIWGLWDAREVIFNSVELQYLLQTAKQFVVNLTW